MGRGRMVYVPPSIVDEVENIKDDHDIEANTEAYRKMVKYCQVGREVERIKDLDFGPRKRRKRKG